MTLASQSVIAIDGFETGKFVIYFVTPCQVRARTGQTRIKASLNGRLSFFAARSPRWQTRMKASLNGRLSFFAEQCSIPHDACKQSVIAIEGGETGKFVICFVTPRQVRARTGQTRDHPLDDCPELIEKEI